MQLTEDQRLELDERVGRVRHRQTILMPYKALVGDEEPRYAASWREELGNGEERWNLVALLAGCLVVVQDNTRDDDTRSGSFSAHAEIRSVSDIVAVEVVRLHIDDIYGEQFRVDYRIVWRDGSATELPAGQYGNEVNERDGIAAALREALAKQST